MLRQKDVVGNLNDYLTVSEAAAFVGVSASTLRNWDRGQKLVAYRHPLNGYRLYKKAELTALIEGIRKKVDDSGD